LKNQGKKQVFGKTQFSHKSHNANLNLVQDRKLKNSKLIKKKIPKHKKDGVLIPRNN
jgi:hypothetical protein